MIAISKDSSAYWPETTNQIFNLTQQTHNSLAKSLPLLAAICVCRVWVICMYVSAVPQAGKQTESESRQRQT